MIVSIINFRYQGMKKGSLNHEIHSKRVILEQIVAIVRKCCHIEIRAIAILELFGSESRPSDLMVL